MEDYIDIVFEEGPGHETGRFVEVENSQGASIRVGQWIKRSDGYWVLRIPSVRGKLAAAREAIQWLLQCVESYPGPMVTQAATDKARDALKALNQE